MLGTLPYILGPKGGPEIFHTDIWTGTGAAKTIKNGVDLDTFDGMVWIKARSATTSHKATDTVRGVTKSLIPEGNDAESTEAGGITAFGTHGYIVGTDADYNDVGESFVAWTFRKLAGFFDIVTYTGTGVAHTEAHSLGAAPGMVLVKDKALGQWCIYHRSNTANPETDVLFLDASDATADDDTYWNDTAPTDAVFTVGTNNAVNKLNDVYVAYLFCHSATGRVQCGTYTATGAAQSVTLGWKPQWLMIKQGNGISEWFIYDSVRNPTAPQDKYIGADTSEVEKTASVVSFTDTGFSLSAFAKDPNTNAGVYLYVAIRE